MKTGLFLSALFIYINSYSNGSGALQKESTPIRIDYRSVDLFSQIPDNVLQALSSYRIVFRHASVGTTITNALDCIQGTRTNPSDCNLYPDYKFDRRNWLFQARPNSGWYGKVDDFVTEVEAQKNKADILTFKFCYLDGLDGLQEPCGSTFSPQKARQAWDYYRMKVESLEKANPSKLFIWITIPLTQVGQFCTDTLNNLIRSYCVSAGKILFDLADIQCHDNSGVLQKNSKGWQIAYQPFCGEQQPGAQACHPNWEGGIRIAKAFWWMVYLIYSGGTTSAELSGETNDPGIRVFPNPAQKLLHIHIPDRIKGFSVLEIFSVSGVKVLTQAVSSGIQTDLNVEPLIPGVYFLCLSGKDGTSLRKKIVLR